VGAQGRCATGQEKAGAPFIVREQHDGDGRRAAAVRGDRLPAESREVLPDSRAERVVEAVGWLIGHALAEDHASPQLRTREGTIVNMTRLAGMVLPAQSRSRPRYFS